MRVDTVEGKSSSKPIRLKAQELAAVETYRLISRRSN